VALAVVVVRGLTASSFGGLFLMHGMTCKGYDQGRNRMRGLSYKDCSLLSLFNQVFSESNLDLGLRKSNYDNSLDTNHRKVSHGSAQQKRKIPNHLRITPQVLVGATPL
jgi:hypothetical protein